MDLPLPWLLANNRAMRVKGITDAVWTRCLDVPAALGARRYATADRLTFAVARPHAPGRPGGRVPHRRGRARRGDRHRAAASPT